MFYGDGPLFALSRFRFGEGKFAVEPPLLGWRSPAGWPPPIDAAIFILQTVISLAFFPRKTDGSMGQIIIYYELALR